MSKQKGIKKQRRSEEELKWAQDKAKYLNPKMYEEKKRKKKKKKQKRIYIHKHLHTHTREAHTPSRRRLRLRGAYQPPSIISMRISIFHPVFPKFMQTSNPFRWPPKLIPLFKPETALTLSLFLSFTSTSSVLVTVLYYIVVCLQNGGQNGRV